MNLGTIKIRLVPGRRCVRCGAAGYTEEKSDLCCACLNISLLLFERWKKREAQILRREEENHGQAQKEQESKEGQVGAGVGTK